MREAAKERIESSRRISIVRKPWALAAELSPGCACGMLVPCASRACILNNGYVESLRCSRPSILHIIGKLWTRFKLNDVGTGSQSVLSTRLWKNHALCSLLNWEMVKKSPPAELGGNHIRGRLPHGDMQATPFCDCERLHTRSFYLVKAYTLPIELR